MNHCFARRSKRNFGISKVVTQQYVAWTGASRKVPATYSAVRGRSMA